MEKTAEITEKPVPVLEQEDNPHIINRVLKMMAYPIAGLSGLFVMGREVHNGLYQKASGVKGNPLFRDIEGRFKPRYAKNAEDCISGIISKGEFLAHEFAIKKEHSHAIGERLDHIGFSNRDHWFGFKNFGSKWRYINNGTKQNAVIQGLTVSGIAIGALLAIANSKSLVDYFAPDYEKNGKSL